MFKLLNINKFIKENNVLEVTNPMSFDKDKLTDTGLYSPRIFGSTSRERSTTFGYINLTVNIMHPSVLNNINKVNTLFSKVVHNEKKALIKDGMLIEDENGKSGVGWLYQNWDHIDLTKYYNSKNEQFIDFLIEKNRDIFINKFLVVPVKYRMFLKKHGMLVEDELTELYKSLIRTIQSGKNDNILMKNILQNSSKDAIIQKKVSEISDYFMNLLQSKSGHVRGSLLSKRIDNNTRLVANARPDIPFNCAGIPWQVLINVFDVFIIAALNKNNLSIDYGDKLKLKNMSISKLGEHFTYIYRNVDTYTENNPSNRELWVNLLKEIFEYHPELRVLLKRDPAWNSKSYHTLRPVIIPTNNYHIVVNSLLYKPLGGDSFNSKYIIKQEKGSILYNKDIVVSAPNSVKNTIISMDKLYDSIHSRS